MKKFLLLGMVLPVLSGCVINEQTRYVESPVATNLNNATNNQAGAATKKCSITNYKEAKLDSQSPSGTVIIDYGNRFDIMFENFGNGEVFHSPILNIAKENMIIGYSGSMMYSKGIGKMAGFYGTYNTDSKFNTIFQCY
ncbi:hypothetical protein U5C36_000591 [Enterobacter hormaechei]|nr:hypothetical protein [Enterobacter hormaechei]EMA8105342.1 hypothetical protein [Enterobacter hormaechei]HCT2134010.1 hypothetical protein [Enterobacter hormaechei]